MAEFFTKVGSIFTTYSFLSDTLDIIFLAFILYSLIKIIRDSRALMLAKGLVLLAVVYLIVYLCNMQASTFIFGKIFENILVILVIIFSPEIRSALEKVGSSRISDITIFKNKEIQKAILYNDRTTAMINSVCRACADMSDKKIGALIIFENKTPLGEVISTGTVIDAKISSELIGNIFYPKAPLHDGGAVVRENRLYAAGCILPLTSNNNDVSSRLGTRHRAAIGMSENSDAIVVVVSEETGYISVASHGKLRENVSDGEVREFLLNNFLLDVRDRAAEKAEKKQKKLEKKAENGGKKDEH